MLLPYATGRFCDAWMGKPGADCAEASASKAPMPMVVLPNMTV